MNDAFINLIVDKNLFIKFIFIYLYKDMNEVLFSTITITRTTKKSTVLNEKNSSSIQITIKYETLCPCINYTI